MKRRVIVKTIDELYAEVMADEDLRKEFLEASEAEKIAEFLKAHGCEATIEEFDEFMKNAGGKSGELDDDELDNVAAGKKCGTVYKNKHPVVTVMNSCNRFICKGCLKNRDEVIKSAATEAYAPKCHRHGCVCGSCKYCEYKGGLWLCLNEDRINN